ncbi:MAG: radical SAM family heme chaperone HemW, partial [Proteobacteria bacterium]
MRSLYIHFPFCETKCHYCDFYSIGREKTRPEDAGTFERALLAECKREANRLAPEIDTIFFGGGTPSMTDPDSMARAIEPLQLSSRIHSGTEWTMEANPSSIDRERLTEYKKIGVNRISMGVQSLNDARLAALGRVHGRDEALDALETLFSTGFSNVSVDLLCGVPDQPDEELEAAMKRLLSFPITHLSCYLLTLVKGHAMYKKLPDEDTQLRHLLLIDRVMKEHGFEHYEISNFCKPGKQARHNLAYWKRQGYLGLGPSAHSYDSAAQKRWKNTSNLNKYATLLERNESPIENVEELSTEQLEIEKWMLALRLSEGVPEQWLTSINQKQKASIYRREGLIG